jgi:zeaxanthin glucosyltransferase
MHIALICPESSGHLNPMATLGRELARRGHRISLLGRPHVKPRTDALGIDLIQFKVSERETRELQEGLQKLATLKGLDAVKLTARLLRDLAALTLRDGPERLRAAGVDAALVDQVSLAGVALADTLRLPFVIACNSMLMHYESRVPPWAFGWRYRPGPLGRLRNRLGNMLLNLTVRPVINTVSEYRLKNGFPHFRMGDINGLGLAHVAQQPAFFDYPRMELPAHFHYTGPWHEPSRDSESAPFPWEKLNGRPLVYATLGTMLNRPEILRAILDGCAELPIQVVLSLGRKDAACDLPAPANAIVAPFVPQLALLGRASLMITAGTNSVLEGLCYGVPMLCIPVANDQAGVARRVERLGAGESLKPGQANATRIRALVEKLLAGKYREAAQKCREQLKNNQGLVRAADIVEQAFHTGRRVVR